MSKILYAIDSGMYIADLFLMAFAGVILLHWMESLLQKGLEERTPMHKR